MAGARVCPKCGGAGGGVCGRCGGAAYITCPTCKGKRWNAATDRECTTCYGTGIIPCRDCDAKGGWNCTRSGGTQVWGEARLEIKERGSCTINRGRGVSGTSARPKFAMTTYKVTRLRRSSRRSSFCGAGAWALPNTTSTFYAVAFFAQVLGGRHKGSSDPGRDAWPNTLDATKRQSNQPNRRPVLAPCTTIPGLIHPGQTGGARGVGQRQVSRTAFYPC